MLKSVYCLLVVGHGLWGLGYVCFASWENSPLAKHYQQKKTTTHNQKTNLKNKS